MDAGNLTGALLDSSSLYSFFLAVLRDLEELVFLRVLLILLFPPAVEGWLVGGSGVGRIISGELAGVAGVAGCGEACWLSHQVILFLRAGFLLLPATFFLQACLGCSFNY